MSSVLSYPKLPMLQGLGGGESDKESDESTALINFLMTPLRRLLTGRDGQKDFIPTKLNGEEFVGFMQVRLSGG